MSEAKKTEVTKGVKADKFKEILKAIAKMLKQYNPTTSGNKTKVGVIALGLTVVWSSLSEGESIEMAEMITMAIAGGYTLFGLIHDFIKKVKVVKAKEEK